MTNPLFQEVNFVRNVLPVLVLAMHAFVFRWLWKRSCLTKARAESGRMFFPPMREIRILLTLVAIVIAALLVWCSLTLEPREWWLPYALLGFLIGVPFLYPPLLVIEVDGIVSHTWFGTETKIRWEDICSLHYNMGNKYFTLRAKNGRKIVHSAFHPDILLFQEKVRERTQLPLNVEHPGFWKTKTTELPYRKPK